ncbi:MULTISPECIES: hypothetical protein [Empedobacter]|uniref:hypothetical protein n=1 Tax=Empedobacter TaxID=59734 RepID=UPI00257753BD|nr:MULTISPECIES: hypothetical protein [Empedobacter]MDM1040904.1 hypothetical protein [Empedobacter brevis]MDM1134485.1 hypothetical protein [Empedobacter sp. R750]
MDTAEQEFLKNEITVAIVQKLQGTKLFSLLENSIENAFTKIAALLDRTISSKMDFNSSNLIKGLDDFDIGEYI